jgi:peptidoglycan/LPS O-acetylase OafA/YrhL
MAVRDVLTAMEQIGFTEIILPFILVFTVVFAVLQRSKVLGVDAKGRPKGNYNAMVAFVLAFFVLVMVQTLQAIAWFTRYAALLIVAFVFLGIIFSFMGVHQHHKDKLMFVALVLLSFVFIEVLAYTGVMDPEFVNRFLLPILAVIAVLVGAWFMLHREKPKPSEKRPKAEFPGIEKEKVVAEEKPAKA